jgi:putative DNA primase/helicase
MDDTRVITTTITLPLISRDLNDFGRPGVWIEVDPDVAETMGAFEETAVAATNILDHTDATEYFETVARLLIEQLRQGAAPWQRPRPAGRRFMPFNPMTGRSYRGVNAIWLLTSGYDDPRWLTEAQASQRGAQIRPGEKGTQIQCWIMSGADPIRFLSNIHPIRGEINVAPPPIVHFERPRLRIETLYNAEQIDGLTPLECWTVPRRKRHQFAERLLQNSGARILHTACDHAVYQPSKDSILMPDRTRYASIDAYFTAALLQLAHWTAAPGRLHRDIAHPFGSVAYAREELRAIIATMRVANDMSLGHDPTALASYSQAWIKLLHNDPKEIFRAAQGATAIADMLSDFAFLLPGGRGGLAPPARRRAVANAHKD